jgi:hypothetical protein
MMFVVETVLRVVTLCVAAGFPLNGVIGFSIGGSSADRHLWAAHRGFVPGTSAAGCRGGVAGLLILLGGMDFDVTGPLHSDCLGRKAVTQSADGKCWGVWGVGYCMGCLA